MIKKQELIIPFCESRKPFSNFISEYFMKKRIQYLKDRYNLKDGYYTINTFSIFGFIYALEIVDGDKLSEKLKQFTPLH